MALIRCPDCGREVSDSALACPNCARPFRTTAIHAQAQRGEVILGRRTGGKGWVLAAVLAGASITFATCVSSIGDSPSSSTPAPTSLQAGVRHTGTKIVVTNKSGTTWRECRIRLNGDWEYNAAYLAGGDSLQIGIMMFTDDRGQRFNPITHTPKDVRIRCRTPGASYYGGWG